MIRRSDKPERDQGFTLIELLVATTVGLAVIAIVSSAILGLLRSQRVTRDRSILVQQAHLAVQQIERQVRSGNVLYPETGGGSELKVYTQANGNLKCVEYQYDNLTKQLRFRSWAPGDPGQVTDWRMVASHIDMPAGEELFDVVEEAPYGGRLLDVDIYVADDDGEAGTQQVALSVAGRNTTYEYGTGPCAEEPA